MCAIGLWLALNHTTTFSITDRNARSHQMASDSTSRERQTIRESRDSASGMTATPGQAALSDTAGLVASYRKIPLTFEMNRGQVDNRVRFLSRGHGYTIFLTSGEAVLSLRQGITNRYPRSQGRVGVGFNSLAPWSSPTQNLAYLLRPTPTIPVNQAREQSWTSTVAEMHPQLAVRMRLVGANLIPNITGLNELPGRSNYLVGRDPGRWQTNLPRYARVKYRGVYPGVDLIYYGNQQEVECDFVIAPGAEPRMIKIHFEGSEPRIDPRNGDLVLEIGANELRFHKPVVYQSSARSASKRHYIDGEYDLDDQGNVSFQVANYDHTQPVIVDPVLSYSTYLGGSQEDLDLGVAVDSSGSAYVSGQTLSSDFPVANAMQTSLATRL
jgi:hypothetical protein